MVFLLRPLLALGLLLSVAPARAAIPALRPGEEMTFEVGWGIFSPGEITIAARSAPPAEGQPRLAIDTTIGTKGLVGMAYKFNARGESLFDATTGRLLSVRETSKDSRKQTDMSVTFDYTRRLAKYEDRINPAKSTEVPLPPGEPMDLIMALVQTRAWDDMKPGDKRDTLVLWEDEFYELTIYAEKFEDVRTRLGKFRTLVLVPKMEKTPPKGMFRRGSTVRVWVSQDARRLPVKFELEMKIGAAVATLIRHKAPPAATPAAK